MIDEYEYQDAIIALFIDGVRVFTELSFDRLSVSANSQLATQPLESGSEVVDHKIDLLDEVMLITTLPPEDCRNAYESLHQRRLEGTIFAVKTPVRFYDSMVIQSLSHQVAARTPDKVEMLLSFSEYRYFEAGLAALPLTSVSDPSNSSTIDRGRQQGTAVAANEVDESSVLYGILLGGSDAN